MEGGGIDKYFNIFIYTRKNMIEQPIRVLQITGGMDMGGIENFIMNIYRNIDRNKVQFDFLIHQEKEQIFEEEIKKLGGNIYRIPSIKKIGYFNYKKELKNFFEKNKYKIVHSHYNELSGLILKVAKKCGIKNRIAHSHTSYPTYKNFFIKIFSKFLILQLKDKNILKLACSREAGEWLYGINSKFEIINNGVNPQEYIFNTKKRNEMREKAKLKANDIVIGHIGRFSNEKNHSFLIDIFNELLKINENYKLLLVGDGNTREEIEKKIKSLKLEDGIRFLGVRKDVKNILQGLDIFILPSIFEGLPVTLVEAQGAGLKCFISDSITKEIDLECGLIKFIGLDKSALEWAKIIDINKEYKREDKSLEIKKNGFDIVLSSKILENMYIALNK